jgi:transcriptional regulator with XRE-family HTH domain
MDNTCINIKEINHRQITLAREFRGYNQSQLTAKIVGLSQSNLSKYEKGLDGLSEEMLIKLMDFLEFLDYLINL